MSMEDTTKKPAIYKENRNYKGNINYRGNRKYKNTITKKTNTYKDYTQAAVHMCAQKH